jgi:hypothetical protein
MTTQNRVKPEQDKPGVDDQGAALFAFEAAAGFEVAGGEAFFEEVEVGEADRPEYASEGDQHSTEDFDGVQRFMTI